MELCDDSELAKLAAAISTADANDLAAIDEALLRFPQDPRLHFLRGSILVERKLHLQAHGALTKAVELAPDFHVARYQLGFFELTSGEADQALSTLAPLLRLPANHHLRKFVEGLTHLIRDEFEEAIVRMREGIELNRENEPMNNDIRRLLAECEKTVSNPNAAPSGDVSDLSATSILLGRFGGSDRPN